MRILYVIDGMFNSAGRERVVANKSLYLTKKGHEVTIITTNQRGRESYYQLPHKVRMIDLGINYDEYNGKNVIVKVCAYLRKNILFKERLKEFIKENPQDVIVSLMDRYLPAILQFQEESVTVYENHFNKFAMYDLRESQSKRFFQQIAYGIKDFFYKNFYYKKLDVFAVLTKEDKEYWGKGFDNIVYMPNSITYNENIKANLENKLIISVGRITYQKGYDRLVEVWKKVSKQFPDWQLNIYGSGEDKESLLDIIEKEGLNNIHIFDPTPKIEEKLLEASLYVMTSRFEGLPMALLESMAVGLPLVSFDCKCGPKDVIRDGENGYLVKDGDINTMSEKIKILLSDKELRQRMGRIAKQYAADFSHENIIDKWVSLFEEKKHEKNLRLCR